jgi:uncharacterized protein DUF4012
MTTSPAGPPDDGVTEPEDSRPASPFDGPEWDSAGNLRGGGAASSGGAPAGSRVRGRRRTSRRTVRRRRRFGLAMLLVGLAIVVVFAWVLVTALLARSQLQQVRTEVRALRAQIAAGDLPAARATAGDLSRHAARAHTLTSGPAWAVVAALPGGAPLSTIRTITAQADTLGNDVLPALVRASTQLDPATLRGADGRIDVQRVAAAAPTLDRAGDRMVQATVALRDQPAHTWIGAVDSARADLITQLTSLQHTVNSADLAAHAVPAMLGQHGVKRYFVAFQNEAEARGTGGLPGAFAILRADNGKVSFERFEPDNTLGFIPTGLDFGPQYDKLFGPNRSTSMYVNSNASPHYPYAAQVWIAMWRKYSGQRLDGAMAVDPTALSYLLQVTGPAQLPDGTTVSAANVVQLTQAGVYAKFPRPAQNTARKNYLLALARASSKQVLDSRGSVTALVKAAGRAAVERRLLVYSTDPAVEARIEQTSLSGVVPQTSAPFTGMTVLDVSAGKMDYYLDRSLTWQRTGCGATRSVTVTMRLRNNTPATGLSKYVTDRVDTHSYPVKPGDSRAVLSYYATHGARIESAVVDGQPVGAVRDDQLGHPVFSFDLELPRARTRTIVLHLREPAGVGSPIVLRQPLVRPLTVNLDDARCR